MNVYMPEGLLYGTERNKELTASRRGLEKAAAEGLILEGRVSLCDHKMGLHIELARGITGVIPKEEVLFSPTDEPVKDIAVLTRVGKTVAFKITGVKRDDGGECVLLLSRREAQKECYENFIKNLTPGDIIRSRITHLENFGAFLDIGCGMIALLSIDTISVSRISHPSARLSVGDVIFTVVKNIDAGGRIFVSERELLGSWEENAALFSEGQTVRGIVRSVENYGIFVELKPNLAGLAEYRDDVLPGQCAAVYIKSIIPEKMKIKLIIIDAHDAEYEREPLEYFINTDAVRHIDAWTYSPPSCKRVIESVF
ncbi:MAG: S1 RNA-binding domain-containing protein [Clostridia bacterium]|nr:S1 RNA-binding domain-containing protein [Clostridia bacterium]